MFGVISFITTVFLLTALAAGSANAFEIGINVKAVGKSGKDFQGRITGVANNKSILLIDEEGCKFQMPLEMIRLVENVEGRFFKADNGTKLQVVKITKKDGQTVYGGLTVSAAVAFEHESGTVGNLMIPDTHRFSSIMITDAVAMNLE